ncbi:HNH endonuclease [Dyella marensis]
MQRFVNFIFYQVWCRAPKAGPYDLRLFDANPALKEVMTAFAYDHTKAGDHFSTLVQAIYKSFAQLTRCEIAQFKRWHQANNNIQLVCANNSTAHIVRYADLPAAKKVLCDQLAAFFKGLYSQSLLDLAALKEKIGDIDDHYKSFVKVNNRGKCPFCGISDMLGPYHTKREAYDHYLPKALYPFNSINFKNLVPACHQCNSSYKTSKDPAHPLKDPAGAVRRRKIFYPYRANAQDIEISVSVAKKDVDTLVPDDISFDFGPADLAEELATWCDVYGIEERYRAKLLGENDGKYWVMQALEEWSSDGKTTAELLAVLARQTEKRPFAECNFLKSAYLQGCHKVGIL